MDNLLSAEFKSIKQTNFYFVKIFLILHKIRKKKKLNLYNN